METPMLASIMVSVSMMLLRRIADMTPSKMQICVEKSMAPMVNFDGHRQALGDHTTTGWPKRIEVPKSPRNIFIR